MINFEFYNHLALHPTSYPKKNFYQHSSCLHLISSLKIKEDKKKKKGMGEAISALSRLQKECVKRKKKEQI